MNFIKYENQLDFLKQNLYNYNSVIISRGCSYAKWYKSIQPKPPEGAERLHFLWEKSINKGFV